MSKFFRGRIIFKEHRNGTNDSGAGIHATGSQNRIDANNVIGNDIGIDVDGADNFIVRNSASTNTTNYSIAAGNADAQRLTPGTAFVSTDPWANYSY